MHTSFKLSKNGETVALFAGKVIDTVGEVVSPTAAVVAFTAEDCAEVLPAAS